MQSLTAAQLINFIHAELANGEYADFQAIDSAFSELEKRASH